jgi:hypothetical protein
MILTINVVVDWPQLFLIVAIVAVVSTIIVLNRGYIDDEDV